MSVKVHISPRIVNSVASLYNDSNRIFMEYIDNAIDSADQNWFDEALNAYSKPIEIKVVFSGKSARDAQVTISDNCFGITNFTKVVENIGDSDKKAQGFTNGQFGFGMHSYMAACKNLEVTSKEKTGVARRLSLSREMFDKARAEDVVLPDEKVVKDFPSESGTIIKLNNFDAGTWKAVDPKILKNEIEKHFELILHRANLAITITYPDGAEDVCVPFDYNIYKGEEYSDYIYELTYEGDGRRTNPVVVKPKRPIHVFLKMTEGVSLNKAPVFISKGRRICEIKDVKLFKSKHKSDIWGHNTVTGYIDVQDILDPTIARDAFKNTDGTRALFEELYKLEDLIAEYVRRANAQTDEKHYQKLEDVLNKALSKLAKVDAMNFRTTYLKGGETQLAGGSIGSAFMDEGGVPDFGDEPNASSGESVGDEGEDGVGQSEEGEDPGGVTEGENAKNEPQFADSEFTGQEKKKSGFNIRISDSEPQIDADTNKPLRSLLSGDEIVLYKKHPDFQTRVRPGRQGDSKITHRLLAYIAGEITVHYKDQFYNKHENGQPEYNKNMFVSMAEFMYQLEDMLAPLDNKNLSELS
jgi:hypothetical protein